MGCEKDDPAFEAGALMLPVLLVANHIGAALVDASLTGGTNVTMTLLPTRVPASYHERLDRLDPVGFVVLGLMATATIVAASFW
eukprot:106838-Pyramimonas_sp.AAC.1